MNIFRDAREKLPITAGCILLSLLLFAAVAFEQSRGAQFGDDVLIAWGVCSRFALWDGNWWLVFTTAFHHGNLLHLAMNAFAMWLLGGLLEPRLGSLRYALFLVGGILVPGVAQCYTSEYVGLSGVWYAIFGALLVVRQYDSDVALVLNERMVQAGIFWLFACVFLTYFKILPVANVAHFVGLIYGWIVGIVLFKPMRSPRAALILFLGAHWLLIPGFYYMMHPIWDGTYHWRLADLAGKAKNQEEALREYRRAVECDPQLAGPWFNLGLIHFKQGRRFEAWGDLLSGIQYNPGYEDAIQLAREVSKTFRTSEDQDRGREQLREIFGANAPQWEKTLFVAPQKNLLEILQETLSEITNPTSQPDEQRQPAGHEDLPRPLPAPDAAQPGSAEEGQQT